MDFAPSTQQQALIERLHDVGERAEAAEPDARLALLADAGVLGLSIEQTHGGGGHSLLSTALGYEALGSRLSDGGVLLAAGAHLFGVAMTLQRIGSPAQKRACLPELARGTTLATVAATEASAGSDVGRISASLDAHPDGGYRASGHKAYVTRAASAGLYLFVGRASGQRGLSVALLPRSESIRVSAPLDTIGLRGAQLARVHFDDVPLGEDALLGKPGAGMAVFQLAMTYERALVLAFRLGAMQRQLDDAIRFARGRRLGDGEHAGPAIASHQAVSQRIARMHARLQSARLLTYRAAWLLDEGKRAQADAALAKWQLAEAAVASALDDMRLRAGSAYLVDSGRGALLDDTLGGAIHSGTADVLASIVARWLGL